MYGNIFLSLTFVCIFFGREGVEAGSYHIAQAGLEFEILLHKLPECCWDYKHTLPCLAQNVFGSLLSDYYINYINVAQMGFGRSYHFIENPLCCFQLSVIPTSSFFLLNATCFFPPCSCCKLCSYFWNDLLLQENSLIIFDGVSFIVNYFL